MTNFWKRAAYLVYCASLLLTFVKFVCASLSFGFESGMWDSIVTVLTPDNLLPVFLHFKVCGNRDQNQED